MIRGIAASCLLLALGSCARPQLPVAVPAPAVLAVYRVQVGDVLGVRVYMNPELDEDVTVRPDGKIGTTLVQALQAAGRLPDEIGADLHSRYALELKNPELTVEVKTPSPQRVFVSGEVIFPGEYDSAGVPFTLMQAIARAGGLRPTGDPARVFIVRRQDNGKPAIFASNYQAAASGRAGSTDITLASFDVVYVPKSAISQAYLWFNQHFQQFVPVNWGFSYNVNPYVNNTKQ